MGYLTERTFPLFYDNLGAILAGLVLARLISIAQRKRRKELQVNDLPYIGQNTLVTSLLRDKNDDVLWSMCSGTTQWKFIGCGLQWW